MSLPLLFSIVWPAVVASQNTGCLPKGTMHAMKIHGKWSTFDIQFQIRADKTDFHIKTRYALMEMQDKGSSVRLIPQWRFMARRMRVGLELLHQCIVEIDLQGIGITLRVWNSTTLLLQMPLVEPISKGACLLNVYSNFTESSCHVLFSSFAFYFFFFILRQFPDAVGGVGA